MSMRVVGYWRMMVLDFLLTFSLVFGYVCGAIRNRLSSESNRIESTLNLDFSIPYSILPIGQPSDLSVSFLRFIRIRLLERNKYTLLIESDFYLQIPQLYSFSNKRCPIWPARYSITTCNQIKFKFNPITQSINH